MSASRNICSWRWMPGSVHRHKLISFQLLWGTRSNDISEATTLTVPRPWLQNSTLLKRDPGASEKWLILGLLQGTRQCSLEALDYKMLIFPSVLWSNASSVRMTEALVLCGRHSWFSLSALYPILCIYTSKDILAGSYPRFTPLIHVKSLEISQGQL